MAQRATLSRADGIQMAANMLRPYPKKSSGDKRALFFLDSVSFPVRIPKPGRR
jgi:hypothetical protein